MKNLDILNSNKATSFPSTVVTQLAKRFPQLGLADSGSLRCLEEEFLDFTLSPAEGSYNAVIKLVLDPSVGRLER